MLVQLRRLLLWAIWSAFLAGCSASPQPPVHDAAEASPPHSIVIDNFTFTPGELVVAAGTTVTWINRDDVPHTVTSTKEPRLLDSPPLDTDQQYTYTFEHPGTFPYYCKVHPHMTARIIVK